MKVLRGAGLNKRFRDGVVGLKDVNVQVDAGRATMILGPSGGGKSTLLRVLSLLDPADSGTITIDETEVSLRNLNRNLAPSPWPALTLVFQSLFLFPHLTLRENICLPVRRALGKSKRAWISHVADSLGITMLLDRFPNQVSLGQRQRAALARALALEPRYLLLDEITSALDVEHIAAVGKMLSEIKDHNVGMLIATHLLGFARDVGDNFIFLDHGAIIEAGPLASLSTPSHPRVRQFIAQTSGAI